MSMIVQPIKREPVEIDPRRMTPARRARILAAFGNRCAYPACECQTGLELDHTIALALGGKDRDDNLRPLCGPHHAQKTKLDLGLIAKAKRRGLKHRGEFPKPKRVLKGRGFERRWEPN